MRLSRIEMHFIDYISVMPLDAIRELACINGDYNGVSHAGSFHHSSEPSRPSRKKNAFPFLE